MERRILGRTGERVSCFGFGGIVVNGMEQKDADRIVAEAVDRGINYFDVAPTYGNSEDKLGPALLPYRQQVLLACKTQKRTKEEAAKELQQSLKKLQTDHFDVYQFHAVDDPKDIETIFGPNGAMEAVLKAREEGLVRFIGFSSHVQETALTLLDRFDFDTVLFPVNWVYWLKGGKGEALLKKARERNMGRIAIKALAHRKWQEGEDRPYSNCWYRPIFDDDALARLALSFTLSQPVSVALSPGDVRMLRLGMDIADSFQPLNPEEVGLLRERAQGEEPLFGQE